MMVTPGDYCELIAKAALGILGRVNVDEKWYQVLRIKEDGRNFAIEEKRFSENKMILLHNRAIGPYQYFIFDDNTFSNLVPPKIKI
jgi:hypothetical protein